MINKINYSDFVRIYVNLFKFSRVCEFCSDCANFLQIVRIVQICSDFVYCANFVRIVQILCELCEKLF